MTTDLFTRINAGSVRPLWVRVCPANGARSAVLIGMTWRDAVGLGARRQVETLKAQAAALKAGA